jgi:putative exporter of polyketide antibiotics
MKLRPGYKRLVASWAVIALPSLYYGIPYSEGDIAPRFTNIGGTVMWLLAMIILLLPLISLPYFLNRQDEPERDVDYAQQHED